MTEQDANLSTQIVMTELPELSEHYYEVLYFAVNDGAIHLTTWLKFDIGNSFLDIPLS